MPFTRPSGFPAHASNKTPEQVSVLWLDHECLHTLLYLYAHLS